jgi:hypothetical protein
MDARKFVWCALIAGMVVRSSACAQDPAVGGPSTWNPSPAARNAAWLRDTAAADSAGKPIVPVSGGDSCPESSCCNSQCQCGAIFTPYMLGDFTGPLANLFSEVKIGEGEGPLPADRVFLKGNYYNNLNKSRWTDPTEAIHNVDLYRNTFGFEKTFFNQAVSLGVRIPFNTINAESKPVHLIQDPNTGQLLPSFSDEGFDTTLLGNISAIVKAALWEDRAAGNGISGGVTLSLPTASNKKIDPGMSSVTFVQPFTGYVFNSGDWFVQGFSSLTAPIVFAQSIVMFNDLGVGYWMMRNGSGYINGFAPTMELHVATPLRQIDLSDTEFGSNDGLRVHNVFDMTLGGTVLLKSGATWGVGVNVPFTGPKPYDVEAISQFNYRF